VAQGYYSKVESVIVVLQGKNMHVPNESLDSPDIFETPSFSQGIPIFVEETIMDDVYVAHDDHHERIWEYIQT